MTVNELTMLICGFALGAWTIAAWHMVLDMRAARRDLARSKQARKRSAGDHFLNSLKLYQLQRRLEACR